MRRASFTGTKFGGGGTPVVERFAFTTGQAGGLGQGQHFLQRILRSKKRNSAAAEKRGRGGKEKGFGGKEFPPRPSGNYQNSASGFSRKKVRILSKRDSKRYSEALA